MGDKMRGGKKEFTSGKDWSLKDLCDGVPNHWGKLDGKTVLAGVLGK